VLKGTRTAAEWLESYKKLYPELFWASPGSFPPGLLSRDVFLYLLTGQRAKEEE